jgi:hypothetical protein
LTPTSPSNQGYPSNQGLLTIQQNCGNYVPERAQQVPLNRDAANRNLFLVLVSHPRGALHSVFGFDRESARKVLKPPHEFANKSPHRVQKAKKSLLFSLLISASSAEAARAAS